MATITLTNDLTNGSTADADEVMENFEDIQNECNGSLDGDNISSSVSLSGTPKMDAIAERTSATGVTIDGILLQDDLDTSGIVGKTETQTLTNKRITKRVTTLVSNSTITPPSDSYDIYTVTALATAATFAAPTGTPTQGQTLLIRIKDDGTARALSWNAIYREGTDVLLPTTTVVSKTIYVGLIYNSTDSKWDLVMVVDGI